MLSIQSSDNQVMLPLHQLPFTKEDGKWWIRFPDLARALYGERGNFRVQHLYYLYEQRRVLIPESHIKLFEDNRVPDDYRFQITPIGAVILLNAKRSREMVALHNLLVLKLPELLRV